MKTNKTLPTDASVLSFIATLPDEQKRSDALHLVELMTAVTGFPAVLWGGSIIGFGSYHYQYDSGHQGDAPLVGFSPRTAAISLYFSQSLTDREALLARFGKHKTGKACVYVKRLSDVNEEILKQLCIESINDLQARYPAAK